VKNPLRSEAAAYRFLLGTVVYFAAIVLASLRGGTWWGVGVFAVLTVVATFWFFRRDAVAPAPQTAPRRQSAEGEKRILVVANETVGGRTLREMVRQLSEDVREEVLVVCPALNTPLKHWVSDEDAARVAAQKRLDASVRQLREAGVNVRGEVGDGDPLQAMEDALRTFGADEIVISTHPEGRSNWLERGVVSNARERFAVPITHVVVDLEKEQEEVQQG
jgi:nucleotide-binding universal stress UspA family protein